ncbi:unnamed protein product, partial [Onchocerca flexuosa]|uniref:Peptidase A1 domain-containing protein n=1 Tax=Onchocerca flexuosa TaxID=387005 RepID=A0A183HAA9_9BILA
SSDLWVISTECNSQSCRGNELHPKNRFDPTLKSSTYTEIGRSFSIAYASGYAAGVLGSDVVSFDGFTIPKQIFGVAKRISYVFGDIPIDGIMGLGWPAISSFHATTTMQNILDVMDEPIMTVYMTRQMEPITEVVYGGQITFGAFDRENCDNWIDWVQLTSQSFWQFTITGLQVSSFMSNNWLQGISDTGTSFLVVPSFLMKPITKNINATFSFQYGTYIIDCSMQKTGPDIEIGIGGMPFVIPSNQYVLKYTDENENAICIFGAFENFGVGFGPSWILGDIFIRSYCNVYDFANNRIGFAEPLF